MKTLLLIATRRNKNQERKECSTCSFSFPVSLFSLYSFPYNSIEISRTDLSNSCARTKKKTRARREKTRERERKELQLMSIAQAIADSHIHSYMAYLQRLFFCRNSNKKCISPSIILADCFPLYLLVDVQIH